MIKVKVNRPVHAATTDQAARRHVIHVDGYGPILAELATLATNVLVKDAARAELLRCFDCGELGSAEAYYRESDLPGCCDGCAADYFGCEEPGCDGMHHPEDPCG